MIDSPFGAFLYATFTGDDSSFLEGVNNVIPTEGGSYISQRFRVAHPTTAGAEVEVTCRLVKNTSGSAIAQWDLCEFVAGSRLNVFESTTTKTARQKLAGVVLHPDGLADGYWGWVAYIGVVKVLNDATGVLSAGNVIMASGTDGSVQAATLTNADEVAAAIGIMLATTTAVGTLGLAHINIPE